jgi:hypothetical protein
MEARLVGAWQFRCGELAVVEGFVLGWPGVADLAVKAPMVEPVDPFEDRQLEVIDLWRP